MTINKGIFHFLWVFVLALVLVYGYVYMVKPVIYQKFFQKKIIDPTLIKLNLYSKSASNLLLGTAMQESCIGRLSGNVFQIKLTTAEDINTNYLAYRPKLNDAILQLYDHDHSLDWNLNNNIYYQTALARIVYLRRSNQLPDAENSEALAQYWKEHYNTYLGRGTPAQYKTIYDNYFFIGYWRCVVLHQLSKF